MKTSVVQSANVSQRFTLNKEYVVYLNNLRYKDYEGSILKSKDCGDFKVLKCTNSLNILIEFVDTGFRKICQTKEIKTGSILDRSLPSVSGVGILGDKYPTIYYNSDGKKINLKHYEAWSGMLKRCYNQNHQERHPTYKGCTTSDNFKSYTYFYEWCERQIGFDYYDWCLDKDILVKGNKVYSEDVCVFVPNEINCLFTKTNKSRGKYPIGVHYDKSKKKFICQINRNNIKGCQDYLGAYDCPNEAFLVYKEAKEVFIKQVAEKWKERIDKRVYQALLNYKVEITD